MADTMEGDAGAAAASEAAAGNGVTDRASAEKEAALQRVAELKARAAAFAAASDASAKAKGPGDDAATPEGETAKVQADGAVGAGENVDREEGHHEGHEGHHGEHEHHEHNREEEEEELSLEDVYNPRNLTMDELEMVLYEWEEDAEGVVTEYLDMRVINKLRSGEHDDDWVDSEDEEEEEGGEGGEKKSWMEKMKEKAMGENEEGGTKTKVEFKRGPTAYLNLTDDAAHVVEFYAPWCPHCQNYKWHYIEIADEVRRRSIQPVQFHAVSCDVYWQICSTYHIEGFPTILGWKEGETKALRGIEMNEEEEIEPDMVGEMLGLDLANEAVRLFDWEIEDEEMKAKIEKKMIEQGKKAARTKTAWHEHEPHTHNDRYHNAALSLAFAVKTQLFQTLTADGKMEPKRKDALVDFLNLLDWATPQSWKLRTTFIKEMTWKMDSDAITGRGDVEILIEGDQHRHRETGTEDPWGFVDASETGWAEKMFGGQRPKEELAREDKHWSKSCTHFQPAKGFTCGLWNLFHILTIGSSKPEHELYGFHRGYFVSPHHVAESIRNFVAYFFSCDVCRTNFLRMYDNCGHGHCERLKSEITTGPADGSDPARMELALWLWEVHNSVNARLMKEAALRQNREVSHEEILASRFPTRKMCADCWLDENMTKWDNATVFRFLDEWYWPNHQPVDAQFKSVIAGTAGAEKVEAPIHEDGHVNAGFRKDHHSKHHVESSTSFSSSRLGLGLTSLFFLAIFSLLVVAAVQKKRRERRKKFVDSRFVKKKQGCF